jgi:hypothetical protein
MATLLFYQSPIFSLIMMRLKIRNWGKASVSSAASCWQGVLCGAGSSGSCVLVGALIAVLWTVLERLIFLEVQLVKLLISNSRHVV